MPNAGKLLRYASHVACLHVLSACAGAQNPVSALNPNASSLPPLQCDHFVTKVPSLKPLFKRCIALSIICVSRALLIKLIN